MGSDASDAVACVAKTLARTLLWVWLLLFSLVVQ